MKSKLPEFEKRAKAYFPRKRHELNAPLCTIFDGFNIAYQAYFAYNKLSYMGKSTSILFGVPTIMKTVMKTYKSDKVIVCWDGNKHPKRMETLPTYKSHREVNREPKSRSKFLKQISKTQRLLYRLGITQAYNPNMEGDDMIYWMWKKFSPLYRILIVSADKDLHQFINYDTTVYNPRTKVPYSNFGYVCDNLVEPYQYIDYLCLVGDSSDDIPGYRGIGPSRAASFFTRFKGIKEYLKSDAEFPGLGDKEKLGEIWKRNRLMMDLRYFNEKYHDEKDATFYKGKRNPTYNQEAFERYAMKFGMKTMLTETFQEPFKLLSHG